MRDFIDFVGKCIVKSNTKKIGNFCRFSDLIVCDRAGSHAR